jgi:hypothetical protein
LILRRSCLAAKHRSLDAAVGNQPDEHRYDVYRLRDPRRGERNRDAKDVEPRESLPFMSRLTAVLNTESRPSAPMMAC